MLTLEDIISRCKENSNKVGDTFSATVKLNGRLTSTFGRCTHVTLDDVVIEISKALLATCSDASVLAVVDHEWSHYYTTKRTGKYHGHDKEFRETCAMIGCTNDAPTFKPERCVSSDKVYKYTVFCPTCGEVGHYQRKGSILKNLRLCYCPKCKEVGNLYYKENR